MMRLWIVFCLLLAPVTAPAPAMAAKEMTREEQEKNAPKWTAVVPMQTSVRIIDCSTKEKAQRMCESKSMCCDAVPVDDGLRTQKNDYYNDVLKSRNDSGPTGPSSTGPRR